MPAGTRTRTNHSNTSNKPTTAHHCVRVRSFHHLREVALHSRLVQAAHVQPEEAGRLPERRLAQQLTVQQRVTESSGVDAAQLLRSITLATGSAAAAAAGHVVSSLCSSASTEGSVCGVDAAQLLH